MEPKHEQLRELVRAPPRRRLSAFPIFVMPFFGVAQDLKTVYDTVFSKCIEGDDPLLNGKWTGWPASAKEIFGLPT